MQKIRTLIVDDDDGFRAGMRRLLSLQADIEVVGEARDGNEAYNMATEVHPDVIVMDLQMPVEDGASASRRIIAELPLMNIVVVSNSDPLEAQRTTTEIGAVAFIRKQQCAPLLTATIRKAVADRRKTREDSAA